MTKSCSSCHGESAAEVESTLVWGDDEKNCELRLFLVTAFLFEGSLLPIYPTCPAVVHLFFFCNQEPVLHGQATVYPVGGRKVSRGRPDVDHPGKRTKDLWIVKIEL